MTTSVTSSRSRVHGRHYVVEPPRRSFRPSGKHVSMVATCYLGLIAIVLMTVALHQVLSTAFAAPLFLIAAAGMVAWMHPRITLRR